jgi:hypothetical protein
MPLCSNGSLIDYRVKKVKRAIRFFRILLFACILSVCMVLGIVIVMPRRKEQFADEFKIKEQGDPEDTCENIMLTRTET